MKKKNVLVGMVLVILVLATACGPAVPEYKKGTITDTSYQSEWIGLAWTAPEGFVLATQEEMDAFMDASVDQVVQDEEMAESAKSAATYEMIAQAETGMPNIMVIVEKLAVPNMKEEAYFEMFKTTMEANAASMGLTYTYGDLQEVTVGGQPFQMATSTVDVGGVTRLQEVYFQSKGNYMIILTVSFDESTQEQKEEMMAAFTPYEASAA